MQTPVQFAPGVGPARAALLANLGIRSVEDLLWYLPRDVLDLTDVTPVPRLRAGELQTVCGSVVDIDGRSLSPGRSLSAVLLDCNGHYLRGTWFNQPWVLKRFESARVVTFSGKPKRQAGRWEINNPTVVYLESTDGPAEAGSVLPVYRLTEGVKQEQLRRILRDAVDRWLEYVVDSIPADVRERYQLPGLQPAIRGVHCPASMEEFSGSRRRLLFDDLLEFQLGLAMRRRYWKSGDNAPVLPTSAKIDSRIRRLFPFRFTAGQDQVVKEISADLQSGHAMHRLLQADVGAGKTAVAIYAILVAIAAGYQAVLMAPTEVLANQHSSTIDRILANSRVRRACLTGSLSDAQRRQTLEDIRDGQTQLIIGTQAVIQKDVEFARLGLAVIDEQHKFGVRQRAHFASGDSRSHVLVMTATPIPRSMCLTRFGDLDLSVISDMPPGRQRIVTSRAPAGSVRSKAWDFVRRQLAAGRQAYIICPRVGDSDDDDGVSAESIHRQLSEGELRDFHFGLVHGRLDRAQRAQTMQEFHEGIIQVLVATTVVEVGIDVSNATLMVVMEADRFGLSQLHQLRGRIARGQFQGYCFLFSDAASEDAEKRLAILEQTSDGFRIAEEDYELRGPGDVLGTRQHGRLPLRVANAIRDRDILIEARQAAFSLVDSGQFDEPDCRPLKVAVLERFGELMELPRTG